MSHTSVSKAHRCSSPATIGELQIVIHDQRRINEDAGWLAFDHWVNQRVATLGVMFPDMHISCLPLSVLFEDF